MAQRLRVLVVDRSGARVRDLTQLLDQAGCEVVSRIAPGRPFEHAVAELEPDVVIIEQDSPNRDTLESMRRISERNPRPIVMFVEDEGTDAIRKAVRAGVAAYVVKGLAPERVRPLLEVAIARFEAHREMRQELDRVRTELADRKWIERAKGVVMEQMGISEAEAFAALRRVAQDRNVRLGDLARLVLRHAERIRGR